MGDHWSGIKKRLIVACLLVMGLPFATIALGHEGQTHSKGEEHSEERHAADLGRPGDPHNVTRSIVVEMNDAMRFQPDRISVKRGETVQFVVRNIGKLRHEMVLGTMEDIKRHAEQMRKSPEMNHVDPNQVSVDPGKTDELIWQFTRVGRFNFACLEPGHFEAGMIGEIVVDHDAE